MSKGLVTTSVCLPVRHCWTFPLLSLPSGRIYPTRRTTQNCRKILSSQNACDHLDLRYASLKEGKIQT